MGLYPVSYHNTPRSVTRGIRYRHRMTAIIANEVYNIVCGFVSDCGCYIWDYSTNNNYITQTNMFVIFRLTEIKAFCKGVAANF